MRPDLGPAVLFGRADFYKQFQEALVRSRGLEPPRVAPLAPQASASTNSATTAWGGRCRSLKAKHQATAQHVTNRVSGDKGDGFGRLRMPRTATGTTNMCARQSASAHVGRSREHPLDLDRDPVAAHHHGTLGDGEVVGQNPDLVVLAGIELDHGAAAEPEH